MNKINPVKRNPWAWIPSLYFAEGLPYVVVMTVSVIMYKNLGISNTEIALYTSWLYLPWVIKPLWSPIVDILRTKRFWIISMQLLIGAGLAGVALTIPASNFFQYTLAFLWLLAFSSATHDIAADGFYMLGLSEHDQSLFVGIRSTFYRIAMIAGQGLFVMLAGFIAKSSNSFHFAWMITFLILAGMFIIFFIYHNFILPFPESDVKRNPESSSSILKDFFEVFALYFKKEKIILVIAFLLLYRLGEAQLVKLASPFLLDTVNKGGLGLSTEQVGFVYGTIGIIFLTLGGILGGIAASKHGLKYWIWFMVAAINLPDLVYVAFAIYQPQNFWLVNLGVAIEQFGYGFGFTAYMLFMIYVSQGEHKTAHYAISTAFMALGMMLPGMISGWIQENIGYANFFIWVTISTIPGFILTKFIPLDPEFGKKKS